MNAPFRMIPLHGHRRRHLAALSRRWQERSLGEEMARVNLEMTHAERLNYLSWMRRTAHSRGVPKEPAYTTTWLDSVATESSPAPNSL